MASLKLPRPAVLKLSIKGPVFSPAARLANGSKPISAKSCVSRNTKFPSSKSAGPSALLPANSVLVSVPEPCNSVPKSSVKIEPTREKFPAPLPTLKAACAKLLTCPVNATLKSGSAASARSALWLAALKVAVPLKMPAAPVFRPTRKLAESVCCAPKPAPRLPLPVKALVALVDAASSTSLSAVTGAELVTETACVATASPTCTMPKLTEGVFCCATAGA